MLSLVFPPVHLTLHSSFHKQYFEFVDPPAHPCTLCVPACSTLSLLLTLGPPTHQCRLLTPSLSREHVTQCSVNFGSYVTVYATVSSVFLHVYTTLLCPPGSPMFPPAHLCPLLINGTPSVNCVPLYSSISHSNYPCILS